MTIETPIDTKNSQRIATDAALRPARGGEDDGLLLAISVRLGDGSSIRVDAAEGFHLVELIRAHGLPVKAECGGAGVCATCHVRIPAEWRQRLPRASEAELAKLDEIADVDDASRLACQLVMTTDLDGLEIAVAADSLKPQIQTGES